MKKVSVGIDLGTTYSAVAVFSEANGTADVYKNGAGQSFTPSVVCIENGTVTIGEEAKNEQGMGNVNAAAFYKSMMGDPSWRAYLDGCEYSAEALSGIYLTELVKDIEEANGVEIESAVITVPAYFNDAQREATLRAGEKAGLRVLKIVNEPTAAIIAYGLTSGKKKNVMVYDLGGGTFDITVACVEGTGIEVLATNGNHELGGKNWDRALCDHIIARFFADHGVNIREFPGAEGELMVECEQKKKNLSVSGACSIAVSCNGIRARYEVTRAEFEAMTQNLLSETLLLIHDGFDELSRDTGRAFGWRDIDEVVLVGGSTKMPQVREMIEREYGHPPIVGTVNVDTVVSCGAAIQAALCSKGAVRLMRTEKDVRTGKTVPVTLTLSHTDIVDITAHSLGMLAHGQSGEDFINSVIIPKNSKIGVRYKKSYRFRGKEMQVYVMQGESRDPEEADIVGAYRITGMPDGGACEIDVDYLYNNNGVVEVHAALSDGKALSAVKSAVTEPVSAVIDRLRREEAASSRAGHIDVLLIIDTSGSMADSMDEAHRAAMEMIDGLDLERTSVSVYGFGVQTRCACDWTSDRTRLQTAIRSISCGYAGLGTSDTPIGNTRNNFPDKTCGRVIVVLTDGEWSRRAVEISAADMARADGVIIYAIGIGDAKIAFLDKLSDGRGKKVELGDLCKTFKEIAQSIATEI